MPNLHRPLPSISAALLLFASACAAHKQADATPGPSAPVAALAAPVSNAEALDRIVALARKKNLVSEHLKTLCTEFGPRLTSSTNLARAQAWARDQFESFGLKASIEEWGTFPVGFDRGPWHGRIVGDDGRDLVCGFNSWTPGTNGPVAGPAVRLPKSADDVKSGNWKGAWVLEPSLAGARGGRRGGAASAPASGPATSGADTAAAATEREAIEKALQDAGAAGFVTSSGSDLIVTGGNYRIDPVKLPTAVRVKLRSDDFAKIGKDVDEGRKVVLEFDLKNRFVPGPVSCCNVIADLRGTEKPDEMIIIGGHIDSWDGALGTTDNGTGTATTIEAARLLTAAGLHPKRTIRFMLFSGEEQGLLGSNGWIQKHKDQLPKISAVIVHDGGTDYLSGIAATKAMEPLLTKALEPLTTLDPAMPFKVRLAAEGLPVGIGSDHDAFLRAGVPGFFWDQAGGVDYNHTHHTQYDTLAAERPEYQRHSAVVVAAGAYAIANLDVMLPRENLAAPRGGAGAGPFANRRMLGFLPEEDGVTVSEVTDGGAGEKAGLAKGDKIVAVQKTKVANLDEIRAALREAPRRATITIIRAGKEIDLAVEWPEPPASRPASAPNR